ncbi:hypothetical protein ACLOJK_031390 [Asimina triloba]
MAHQDVASLFVMVRIAVGLEHLPRGPKWEEYKRPKVVNLRVLCLRRCGLPQWWDLSPLGSLRQLECLDLSEKDRLKQLPSVIGELGNLRSLDLTQTSHLEVVERGILPRLTQLEELKMLQSFNEWGTYFVRDSGVGMQASLDEVRLLKILSPYNSLHFTNNLRRDSGRSMEIEGMDAVETAMVSSCDKFASLFPLELLQTMHNLTRVKVDCCASMKTLFAGRAGSVAADPQQDTRVLYCLQTLILSGLPSMRSPWTTGSAVSLQRPTTSSIFSRGNLSESVVLRTELEGGLPNLVELNVVDGVGVRIIISRVADSHLLLPKLRKLNLDGLPQLQSVCSGVGGQGVKVRRHTLEEIPVRSCPRLRQLEPLLGGREGVPSLQKIKVEERWWVELDWGLDSRIKSNFHPLFIQQ